MTLDDWVRNGWLHAHTPSEQDYETVGLATETEVDELGKIVEKLHTAVTHFLG